MVLSEIEPTVRPKPNLLIGESYDLTVNQSIQNLIAEIRKETPNVSHFVNLFYELMQAKIDPPLETIWVYSALSFRGRRITEDDLSNRILITKELFQLISACSGACSSSKSIALLAPVVFQGYKLVVELLGKDLSSKRMKKGIKEVKSLIGVVLGYTSMCCCKDLNKESESNLMVHFADLVRLWIDRTESLGSFLPLVSDEICREIIVGVSSVNYLAGVVIAEMFLLKLCLELRCGNGGAELEKDLRTWVVGTITRFQSFYFFETLVRMLLEPALPATSLLSSEDEILLRRILYDAAVLVEYSFLGPDRAIHIPIKDVRSLAMKRLIITQEAIGFFRKNGDQKRAISYSSSFSSSRLPSQIIKCITNQIGMGEEASRLRGSSPKALIKWLLSLEGEGMKVFEDSLSKYDAKLALDDSKADHEQPESDPEGQKADADLLFYIDNKGGEEDKDEDDEETNESMSAAFVAAAHTMRLTENGGKKRKERGSSGKNKKFKILKHDLSDNSDSDREKTSSVSNDGLSSESEVENPTTDEDGE